MKRTSHNNLTIKEDGIKQNKIYYYYYFKGNFNYNLFVKKSSCVQFLIYDYILLKKENKTKAIFVYKYINYVLCKMCILIALGMPQKKFLH